MSATQPIIKRLDHLGLIAAFCHEIALPGIIDRIIPKHSDHNVSHGDEACCQAKLLAKDIEARHFLGRTLDALYDADVPVLHQAIAEHVVDKLGLKTDSVHLDITSFHVDGEYTQDENLNTIKLVKGYSRDYRPELNQVILDLICENQAGQPVYMLASVATPMRLRHFQGSLNVIFIV